jgi:hypothetical protein
MDATKLSEAAINARRWTAEQVSAEMGRHGRMTGKELATQTGLPYRNLMRCLNAERPFTVDELARVAEVLDVEITTLIGGITSRYLAGSDLLPLAA